MAEDEANIIDDEGTERLHVQHLKKMPLAELLDFAESMKVENASGLRKQDLIFAILQAQTERRGRIFSEGVLEILQDGFGFLRAPDQSYQAGPDIFKKARCLLSNKLPYASGDPLWQYTQPSENILKGNRLSKWGSPQPEISNQMAYLF